MHALMSTSRVQTECSIQGVWSERWKIENHNRDMQPTCLYRIPNDSHHMNNDVGTLYTERFLNCTICVKYRRCYNIFLKETNVDKVLNAREPQMTKYGKISVDFLRNVMVIVVLWLWYKTITENTGCLRMNVGDVRVHSIFILWLIYERATQQCCFTL